MKKYLTAEKHFIWNVYHTWKLIQCFLSIQNQLIWPGPERQMDKRTNIQIEIGASWAVDRSKNSFRAKLIPLLKKKKLSQSCDIFCVHNLQETTFVCTIATDNFRWHYCYWKHFKHYSNCELLYGLLQPLQLTLHYYSYWFLNAQW